MTATLTLSVGQLVEFACRSGDLAASFRGPSAIEGVRAHQRWQRQRGDHWRQEVSLSEVIAIDEPGLSYSQVTLQGRVDLLCEAEALPIIEEIKSCYAPPERMAAGQKSQHWAQLKIYGYLYLLAQQRTSPAHDNKAPAAAERCDFDSTELMLRMIWLRLPDDQPYPQQRIANWSELHHFTLDALNHYLRWQQQVDQQVASCRTSANALQFPYPAFRQGQRAMAASVYRSIRDGDKLLCEAPTGIGKTISALFPAIKALGTGLADQIVFLTAKNSGRLAATAALRCMAERGLDVSYLIIQAKQQACSCCNGDCARDEDGVCPRTVGFFDRLPAARAALLELRQLDGARIADVATRFQLCPFELALQMLPWCNVVICDYNFAFDPVAALGSLQQPSNRIGVLLDEAHNLVDRARQMHSATLARRQLRHGANLATPDHPTLASALRGIDRALGRWHQQCRRDERTGEAPDAPTVEDELVSSELPATVVRAVHRCSDIHATLAAANTAVYPEELLDCLRELRRFSAVADLAAEHHRTISQRYRLGRTRDIVLRLQCLDASDYLAKAYRRFHAVALFSATLSPSYYYRQALGLDEQSQTLAVPSPFSGARQATIVCPAIDTRYRQRQSAIPAIVETIAAVLRSKPGNYMVFFASYRFMLQVADALRERYPELDLQLQQRDATEEQRAAFLSAFQDSSAVLGCAIMGGVFGEGVDYPGDMLLGTIIVGTGLPGISTEQELLRRDYDAAGLNGFDFAYRFPGLCRVLQAAGRVIRSESDRGVVALLDGRFATAAYRQLMPAHWQVQHCSDPGSVALVLRQFWRCQPNAASLPDTGVEAEAPDPSPTSATTVTDPSAA